MDNASNNNTFMDALERLMSGTGFDAQGNRARLVVLLLGFHDPAVNDISQLLSPYRQPGCEGISIGFEQALAAWPGSAGAP
jgi:hypothetical protein